MKKVIAILAVGFLFTAFGFVSDSNPAPNDDIVNVITDDCNCDVVAYNVESESKVVVVSKTTDLVTPFSATSYAEINEKEAFLSLDGRQTNRRTYDNYNTKMPKTETLTREIRPNLLC